MSLNDYTIVKLIGKGSYGEVHLIQNKKEKKQVWKSDQRSYIFASSKKQSLDLMLSLHGLLKGHSSWRLFLLGFLSQNFEGFED